MIRRELLRRLTTILDATVTMPASSVHGLLDDLIEEIKAQGIPDVHSPEELQDVLDQDAGEKGRPASPGGGERLIIENQAILLSGMCVLLTNSGSVAQAAQNALDQIACCRDYLKANERKEPNAA
jgi:hypothetical protein